MQAPENVGSVVAVRELSCPTAWGILVLQPGIEPASPALEGGFLTTGPPGKSQLYFNLKKRIFFVVLFVIAKKIFKERKKLEMT